MQGIGVSEGVLEPWIQKWSFFLHLPKKMKSDSYYVYILSGPSSILYTGVTNDLERRMIEHKR